MREQAAIKHALETFSHYSFDREGVVIPTHCLYPDGDTVSVRISEQGKHFTVSDDGLGLQMLLSSGVDVGRIYLRKAEELANNHDIDFKEGTFFLKDVGKEQMAAALVWVAHISQVWVTHCLGEHEMRSERELSTQVHEALLSIFPKKIVKREASINGDSTKSYRIDNVVTLKDRLLLVDSVANNPNSIATNFLKFTDIKKAHPSYFREAVIKNKNVWKSEDINVISEAATEVIYIETNLEALRKYAA